VLPTGFVSPLLAAQQVSGGNFNISCLSAIGLSYQLEYNADLSTTNWVPAGSPVSGTGNQIVFPITPSSSQEFFRLLITP
jgi:hypothetical protein